MNFEEQVDFLARRRDRGQEIAFANRCADTSCYGNLEAGRRSVAALHLDVLGEADASTWAGWQPSLELGRICASGSPPRPGSKPCAGPFLPPRPWPQPRVARADTGGRSESVEDSTARECARRWESPRPSIRPDIRCRPTFRGASEQIGTTGYGNSTRSRISAPTTGWIFIFSNSSGVSLAGLAK